MFSLNNQKLNTSFSTLNGEKVSKLNSLILDSINQFNLKFKEINDNLMDLKLEFLNHINSVQNLLNNEDDDDNINKYSKTPKVEMFYRQHLSPINFKKYFENNNKNQSIKNMNYNITNFENNNDENLYKRNIHRKKTFTQESKKFKIGSILFNKEKRDDIGKKNVSFLPEQITKSSKRYKEKKIQKKK